MTARAVHLTPPERYWDCPSCTAQHVTRIVRAHTPMHPCPGALGVLVPYTEAHPGRLLRPTDRRHHRIIHRGDYQGTERGLRFDTDGRPVMAVHTERPDGSHDTHVFAPAAAA